MYKALIRSTVRRTFAKLNDGDAEATLKLAAPDAEMTFSGDNSWSSEFRPVTTGRERFVTHRGIDEIRAFCERFVDVGLHAEIEDILVNGPPWNTRVAVRARDFLVGPDGSDEYNNRFVDIFEMRWGRVTRLEVYEDTERIAAWDAHRTAASEQ